MSSRPSGEEWPSRSQSVPPGSVPSFNPYVTNTTQEAEYKSPVWVSATGSGGYHYPKVSNNHWIARREEDIAKMQQQVKNEKAYWSKSNILHHDYRDYQTKPAVPLHTVQALSPRQAKLTSYNLNSKMYCAGKDTSDGMMEQCRAAGHFLMQVNSFTNSYNPISNKPHNVHIQAHLDAHRQHGRQKHGLGHSLYGPEIRDKGIDYKKTYAGGAPPPVVVQFCKGRKLPPVNGINIDY